MSSYKNVLKYIGIGVAAVGLTKASQAVGYFKGVIAGCRLADEDPDSAQEIIKDADGLKDKWTTFKAEFRNRRA